MYINEGKSYYKQANTLSFFEK